jgi:hypothetical protein
MLRKNRHLLAILDWQEGKFDRFAASLIPASHDHLL